MKKLYFLLAVFCLTQLADAQIINFSNAAFKAKLMQAWPTNDIAKNHAGAYIKIDANYDGEIQVSEALAIAELRVPQSNLTDVSDVNHFTALTWFDCSLNQLTSLDVTGLVNLETLYCYTNQLTSLNMTGLTQLEFLECSYNQFTSLNLNTLVQLQNLHCEHNQLTSINLYDIPNIRLLYCHNNQLTSLNASNFTQLTRIICNNNQLTTLNTTNSLMLNWINCSFNQLSSLDTAGLTLLKELNISNNLFQSLPLNQHPPLEYLYFANNQIPSFDLTPYPQVRYLDCSGNPITQLNLNTMPALQNLNCSFTQISELIIPQTRTVMPLDCSNNSQLTHLFIKGYGYINPNSFNISNNPNLMYICAQDLASITNYLQSKIVEYNYNCHINSYCSVEPGGDFYVMQGSGKTDTNANGCGPTDTAFSNMKFNVTRAAVTNTVISDISGNYYLPVASGNYTVTPVLENPSYFSVSPASMAVNFPTQGSPYTQNFCVVPVGMHHDVEIAIIPHLWQGPALMPNTNWCIRTRGTR